ncbi:protein-L-isoaspartate O-methyltransferase [Nonomuraea thailandensis]
MIAGIAERRSPATGVIAQALRKVPRHWFVPSRPGARRRRRGRADRSRHRPDRVVGRRLLRPADRHAAGRGRRLLHLRQPSPSAVVDALELLDLRAGQRVLEVGTGSGWVTALLCRLTGESGRVTSVEEDSGVAEAARRNLIAAGVRPHLVMGDCARGCPERGPYDRMLVPSTAPGPWTAQAAPGAVIVGGNGHVVRLMAAEDEPHRP